MNKYITAALFLTACGGSHNRTVTEPAGTSRPDMLAANIDSTVRPGDDFFRYACGTWIKNNPIPASESGWSIGHEVYDELYDIKRKINEEAGRNANATGDERMIADFWTMAMDSTKTDREGTQPLQELLKKIDGIVDAAGAARIAAELQRDGVDAFWGFDVEQDPKNSDAMAVALRQDGLGLPDRDYYFNSETGIAKVRAEYPGHIARMLTLLGAKKEEAEKSGAAVMRFETALAKASRSLEKLRDQYANYNKLDVAHGLRTLAPHIGWRSMLDSYGLTACDTVIVGQPEFLAALDGLLQRTSVGDLRDYLRFHTLGRYASFLGGAIDQEHFAFYGTVLNGQKTQRSRWKRALDAEEGAMGMVLGKVFVKDHFPAKAKQRYDDLVEAIRDTYREHIKNLDWMSAPTKELALAKLNTMTKKVGYPDKWKDMSTLKIARDSYAANVLRAREWHFDDNARKWGKPVDRTEWGMTPQTYNAEYDPSNNAITLPAGIFMIAGLPDSLADDAMVYGYAAAGTIGHEITHGFDDEGRQYNANGNLHTWWTVDDSVQFMRRAEVMVKQFDSYEPIKGIHINGHATLGENIADLGGVVLGLDAFKKTEQSKKGERIAGFTPLQRYFLGYALGWLGSERDESLREQLLSDVHSPAQYRVNGPFANVPEFYDAFGIKEGDAIWRPDSSRVRIW